MHQEKCFGYDGIVSGRCEFQYTGRENDGTGLYYYRARYYSPELSRFISQDPIGFRGGINQHVYVEGDPISYTDPEGTNKIGEFIFKKITEAIGKKHDGDPLVKRSVDGNYKSERDKEIANGADPAEAQKRYEEKRDNAYDRIDNPEKKTIKEKIEDYQKSLWPPIRDKWFPRDDSCTTRK